MKTNLRTKWNARFAEAAALFFCLMFLQFVMLRIGNSAGSGLLDAARQEHVYYLLQAFVIGGILLHAAIETLGHGKTGARRFSMAMTAFFGLGLGGLFAVPAASHLAVTLTLVTATALGYVCGAVYLRMAQRLRKNSLTALSMGVGIAAAVALQYVLQLRWTVLPVLYAVSAISFTGLFVLLYKPRFVRETQTAYGTKESTRQLLYTIPIAVLFILFCSFYNGYIHHLQIQTGYTDYNVYSWPRLILIPTYLLFGLLGTLCRGRWLPVSALCIGIVSFLNAVLAGTDGSYNLNMCLFYVSIAASVAYYNLTFWKLAALSKRPALWAAVGRLLDSAVVILGGALRISTFSAAVVLTLDIASLAVMIVLMALNGDLAVFSAPKQAGPLPAADTPIPDAEQPDPFALIRERYGLTPGELNVFRELVLTEDKQVAIGERLSIKIRTVQANVTAIYKKTGVSTRAGLVQLFNETK